MKGRDEPEVNKSKGAGSAAKLHRRTAVPAPPEPYVAYPYTLLQTPGLIGRQAQLNVLTDWVGNPAGDRVFCIVAIGGMGKSALSWTWFKGIAPEKMQPLAGRVWWSFYESDASFENFLTRALLYVSDLCEDEIRKLPGQEREDLLFRQLDEQPFLVVLDGLERILNAYNRFDASHLADDDLDQQTANRVAGATNLPAEQPNVSQHRLRQTIDPRAGRRLKRLTQVRASRILISTRLYPSELETQAGAPLPGCYQYVLSGLSKDDAVSLWRAVGVSGSEAGLGSIFDSVERHPLVVQVLASEIANYRKAPGNFARWRADHPGFDPTSLPLVQSRARILQYALQGLQGAVLEVLRSIVAFRMPATYDSLEALDVGEGKACTDAEHLGDALIELEGRGLIGWDRAANRYDAHPIVRGVVWQQTSRQDQQALYQSLEAHFEPMAVPDWKEVESIDDLTPAIVRFQALVELGRYDDAFRLFMDRLAKATLYRLAVHRQRIAWLERLFPAGEHEPSALSDAGDQALVLNELAASYLMSGQPGRAAPLFARSNEIRRQQGKRQNEAVGLSNFGVALRQAGRMREAAAALRQALNVSQQHQDRPREAIRLQELGRVLSTAGNSEMGLIALMRSLGISKIFGEYHIVGGAYGYLVEQRRWLGDFPRNRTLADRAWELRDYRKQEVDFIHWALSQGRAALDLGEFEAAEERLHHALVRARSANVVEHELPALVAIAELELWWGRPDEARARLDEVWEPAELGPYPLYKADAYNMLATIERRASNRDAAVAAAEQAYRAAWCDGPPWAYHWGLVAAKAHLEALRAPKPYLPPFDETKFAPLPDVEINPRDDYWVDPGVVLSDLNKETDGQIFIRLAIDEGGNRVFVENWGTVSGENARVIMILTGPFKDAGNEGGPENYPFTPTHELLDRLDCNQEETFRRRIKRLRDELERLARGAGYSLERDDVIESVQGRGYRLNPSRVRIVAPELLQQSG